MALTNSQYEELMREYSYQQTKDRRDLEKRRERIYRQLPQLTDLDERLAANAVASVEARFSGDQERSRTLREQMHQISRQKADLLAQHGIAPEELELQYACPDCQDTGYIGNRKCHCFRRKAVELFYTQSGLRDILQKENFSSFSFDCYSDDAPDPNTGLTPRENMHHIVSVVRDFLDHFDEKGENLLFCGGTGLGKTFLSHCIARELIESAHSVIYYSAADLFDSLAQEAFTRRSPEESDPFTDYLRSCDLLIIDDLGTELTNAFVSSSLFTILNERIASGKSTLISSNFSLQELNRTYSERIFSRIYDAFTILGFYGDDIRIRRRLEQA